MSRKGKAEGGNGIVLSLAAAGLAVLAAHLVVLMTRLANAPAVPWPQLVPLAVYLGSLVAAGGWLVIGRFRGEGALVAAPLFLSGLGIAVQFRIGTWASAGPASAAMLSYPLGVVCMLLTIALFRGGRYRVLGAGAWICYALSVAVLGGMLVLGRRFRGGYYLPGHVNPTEIVKVLLVVFLASFLAGRKKAFADTSGGIPTPPAGTVLALALLWAVPCGLVLMIRDLGLLVLMNAVLVVMLYSVGRRRGYLALGALGVMALAVAASFLSAHARARFDAWQSPFADPTGKGWQSLQALAAMYAGGLWGAGIGAGTPSAVPIVSSDFVYAAVAEELGFVACGLLLLVYGSVFLRGWRVSGQAGSPFGSLLGVGLTATLCVQTLLNIGGVCKAIPLTGITLPFISQGGSSLATSLVLVGLLAAVSDRRK